jgi:antitoxin (DNA-binding transcriptional repressor) of toxin-antitoxin stability system
MATSLDKTPSRKAPRTVSKSVFKAKALEFFRWVETTGEPLLITHRGTPVLELRPIRVPTSEEILAKFRGAILRYDDPLEPVGLDDWEVLQ